MNCHHCGGIMVFREFSDYGGYWFGWKCIFCGEIVDQIPENHQPFREEVRWGVNPRDMRGLIVTRQSD